MTTLNTIIEEEKETFEAIFTTNRNAGIGGAIDRDVPQILTKRAYSTIEQFFTTAMQRAYEAGVADKEGEPQKALKVQAIQIREEEANEYNKIIERELQKAREEERERLFRNPIELFRGNRIKMTMETREALLKAIDIVPDHSELDQDKQ